MVKKSVPGPRGGKTNRGNKKGQGALRAGSALKKSHASSKANRTGPKGEKQVKTGSGSHLRDESTIKRLNLYRSKPDYKRMKEQPTKPARIQPDRRWFGNTRVIAQDKMQAFRETLSKGVEDPFSVVLRSSKLPMSLLKETEEKSSRMNLLSVEPYSEVFGKRRRQKRAKLGSYDLEGLLQSASEKAGKYDGDKDTRSGINASGLERVVRAEDELGKHMGEEIFNKGTSRRIWGELYKVVDSSDILVEVLDARDPMGTRCLRLEREIRKNRPGKHIILVLNKVDLVPTWAARRWVQVLTKEFPTLAFHASITNPFGKNALLNLLRQFGNLIKERKHLTIGMIGYPNVGKSSVINAMKHKKVCNAAPTPGETKVWQYISLTKRLYLLDCPGIVPPSASDFAEDSAKVLKGVVRAERIETPSDYIDEVLRRVKKPYLLQRYKLPADTQWEDTEDFLSVLGRKMGKLKKGGEPDLEITARTVLYDWQRGRLPFFTAPPEEGSGADEEKKKKAPEQPVAVPAPAPAAVEDGAADPATAGEEGEGGEASAQSVQISVRQSLSELACSVAFDEEDRRGDPLAPDAAAGAAGARKRRRSDEESDGWEGSGEERAPAAPKAAPKKKRRRGRGRGKAEAEGPAPAGGRSSGKAPPVRQGSVDWKAVVAEFDA